MTMRIEIKPYAESATIYFALYDTSQPDALLSGASFVAGDTTISKDGGGFTNTGSNPSDIGSSGVYSLALTTAEMTAEVVIVSVADQTSPKVWMDHVHQIDVPPWRTAVGQMQVWEVENVTSTPGTTGWDADKVAGGDQTATSSLVDRQILFVSGANEGATCFIETYTNSGEDTGTFTVTELQTEVAPSDGDRYVVV